MSYLKFLLAGFRAVKAFDVHLGEFDGFGGLVVVSNGEYAARQIQLVAFQVFNLGGHGADGKFGRFLGGNCYLEVSLQFQVSNFEILLAGFCAVKACNRGFCKFYGFGGLVVVFNGEHAARQVELVAFKIFYLGRHGADGNFGGCLGYNFYSECCGLAFIFYGNGLVAGLSAVVTFHFHIYKIHGLVFVLAVDLVSERQLAASEVKFVTLDVLNLCGVLAYLDGCEGLGGNRHVECSRLFAVSNGNGLVARLVAVITRRLSLREVDGLLGLVGVGNFKFAARE